MSWFREHIGASDHIESIRAPLSREERANQFLDLVEDEDFEKVIITIPSSEESDGSTSKRTDLSS